MTENKNIEFSLKDNKLSISSFNGKKIDLELRRGQLEAITKIINNPFSNLLTVMPTAYGKTIIAIVHAIIMRSKGYKVGYAAPLKALTSEVTEKLIELGFEVVEDTGDKRKNPSKDYDKADIVIFTYERADSIIRNQNNHEIFNNFRLMIIDEAHTVHSKSRGHNLESFIVKLKHHTSCALTCMSATIDNYEQFAKFLDASYVYVPPEERPVKQTVIIKYYDSDDYNVSLRQRNEMFNEIKNRLISMNKQALVFVSSKERAKFLSNHFAGLKETDPIKLSDKSNYAWHHADLTPYQKKTIEDRFKEGKIKFIFCTPTLSAGVNLPAYAVIIYDTTRFYKLVNEHVLIDSMEIEQMVGRAGRPQFEKECEVYIFARSKDSPYKIRESFVSSDFKKNIKGIINEWIISGINMKEEIIEAMKSSLYSIQNETDYLKYTKRALLYLLDNGFISKNEDSYSSTFLGKMTALFYILPETALHFRKLDVSYTKEDLSKVSDLEIMARLVNTEEFLDNIRVTDDDTELIDLSEREFGKLGIKSDLFDARILKVIPMIFPVHFNTAYNKELKIYSNDAAKLYGLMERITSSAKVIILNEELKKRIGYIMTMVKTRTLEKGAAILRGTKQLGDVRFKRLYDSGIKTPEKFMATSDMKLMEIMKVSKETLDIIKQDLHTNYIK